MRIIVDASELNFLAADIQRAAGVLGSQNALAVRSAAALVESSAKAFAPVATGALRDSISSTITGDGRFASMSAEVGSSLRYAAYVEDGTSDTAPQAYLGPAFDRHSGDLVASLEQVADRFL